MAMVADNNLEVSIALIGIKGVRAALGVKVPTLVSEAANEGKIMKPAFQIVVIHRVFVYVFDTRWL